MHNEDELSPIEELALMARQPSPDDEPSKPVLKMISLRIPFELVASIDAFASITNQSRNSTLIHLLKAGVFAVGNALDDPEQFYAAREHFLSEQTGD